METHPIFGRVLKFGPFEVDFRTGELRKRGVRIGLQEQPFRILSALVEAKGDVVGRNELCRRLWPEGTFVDFEHSLNAAVRRLRLALGDQAGVPRFVETVHRRGYRFLALNELPQSEGRKLERSPRLSPPASTPGRARLAVAPFASYGGDTPDTSTATRDDFVDGLMDETITQLACACPAQVGVIARTSVVRAAGTSQGAADLGHALGADYLVGGSVRRDGTRVRIIAQLIESEEETHLWAATYDRVLTDALTVQMEVAEAIARAVAEALGASRPAAVGF